jgi:hypothetical protein
MSGSQECSFGRSAGCHRPRQAEARLSDRGGPLPHHLRLELNRRSRLPGCRQARCSPPRAGSGQACRDSAACLTARLASRMQARVALTSPYGEETSQNPSGTKRDPVPRCLLAPRTRLGSRLLQKQARSRHNQRPHTRLKAPLERRTRAKPSSQSLTRRTARGLPRPHILIEELSPKPQAIQIMSLRGNSTLCMFAHHETGRPCFRSLNSAAGTTFGRTFPHPAHCRECVSQVSEPRAWVGRTRRPSSAQYPRGSSCAGRPHLSPLPRTSRESGPRCSSVPRGPRK